MTAVHLLKMGDILQIVGEVLCSDFIPFVFSASWNIH